MCSTGASSNSAFMALLLPLGADRNPEAAPKDLAWIDC
jgi:hypothetical protein